MAGTSFGTRSFGSSAAAGGSLGWGSRIGALLFGLVFAGFGVVFIFLIGREVWTQAQTRQWMQVPCTVVESRVENDTKSSHDQPYRPVVRYRYTAGGGRHTSEAVELKPLSFSSYAQAKNVTDRYPTGATTTCFVDPHDPARTVLQHGGAAIAWATPLPLLFVVIGAAIIWFSFRSTAAAAAPQQPISISQQARRRALPTTLFFGLFLAVGVAVSFPTLILPAARILRARSWPAVPCTIITSRVQVHRGDDSNSYRPDILYRYTFNGQQHTSSTYGAMTVGAGSQSRAGAAVARYRPRGHATCYVNPADPDEAMLTRDWDWSIALAGIVPIVFIAVGGGGIHFSLRAAGRRRLNAASRLGIDGPSPASIRSAAWADRDITTGPTTLRPRQGPIAKLVAAALIAAFWNGIMSIFVVNLGSEWHRGRGDACGTAFLTPFVLIGLGLIAWLVYQFLATFNPRPELTLNPGAIPLGGTANIAWTFAGRPDRIRRLRITLEGREEATYRRGTDTRTDKRVFHRHTLADLDRATDVEVGKATFTVPADTMHTFSAPNNKIVWELKVDGDIAGWPDVSEAFPIQVLPLPLNRPAVTAAAATTGEQA